MAQVDAKIIQDEEEFLDDVAAFPRGKRVSIPRDVCLEQHSQYRRTNFDREGKLSGRPMSLHKLYKMVIERGGYDRLSKERMAWRALVPTLWLLLSARRRNDFPDQDPLLQEPSVSRLVLAPLAAY